jgi:hypothetical protein
MVVRVGAGWLHGGPPRSINMDRYASAREHACARTLILVTLPLPRQENICKDTLKNLLTCAGQKEYVAASDTWIAGNNLCLGDVQTVLAKCKGAAIEYVDSGAANPAYAVAAVRSVPSLIFAPPFD